MVSPSVSKATKERSPMGSALSFCCLMEWCAGLDSCGATIIEQDTVYAIQNRLGGWALRVDCVRPEVEAR